MSAGPSLRSPVRPADHPPADRPEAAPIVESEAVFPQSVASGGPTPTGVICWTRIAPDAYRDDATLGLEVAADDEFESLVTSAAVPATEFGRQHDYTVRVDLDGELSPDRRYYYRFRYDGVESNVGRCRTLPAPDADPEELSLAVTSCQHYQNGYFGALGHVADADVDFVLHLGDYIYESADQRYRAPGARSYPGRKVSLPSGESVVSTLADFRTLYRTYRADERLQRAHEQHTFLRCWDDHAVTNNRYWDYDADAPAAPDHPRGDDPAFMRQLTADGIQSWWEYTPARIDYDPDAEHLHDAFRLWRRIDFGSLASLVLTDERLFRSEPPSGGDTPGILQGTPEPAPERTMLGEDQLRWFTETVRGDTATWTVWGNEVLSMPFEVGLGPLSTHPNLDAWDGYPRERSRVFGALARAGNTVTLTGDMHTALAGVQERGDGTPVGVEFMTPSVTSVNIAEAVHVDAGLRKRLTRPLLGWLATVMNPHLSYFDSHHWGYSTVDLTPESCTFTAYSVDKSVDGPKPARDTLARFRVPTGETAIERLPTETQ